jgi:hypothetical protein
MKDGLGVGERYWEALVGELWGMAKNVIEDNEVKKLPQNVYVARDTDTKNNSKDRTETA